jgi:hypothetical protein
MKIVPVGDELCRAKGRTDGRTDTDTSVCDEASSLFSKFCERT